MNIYHPKNGETLHQSVERLKTFMAKYAEVGSPIPSLCLMFNGHKLVVEHDSNPRDIMKLYYLKEEIKRLKKEYGIPE